MTRGDRPAGRSRRLLRAAVIAIATTALHPPVSGGVVRIVLSADTPPFRAAEEAARRTLAHAGHESDTVVVDALSGPDIRHAAAAGASFLAVGLQAAAELRDAVPAGAPVGYCMVPDGSQLGFTQNPIAGVGTDVPVARQFDLVRRALPGIRRVGILYRASSLRGVALRDAVLDALPDGWAIEAIDVDRYPSEADAINALFERDIDVVWTGADASVYDSGTVRALLLRAIRERVPVFGFSLPFVKAGALLGIGIDPAAQGRQGAEALLLLHDSLREGGAESFDADGSINMMVEPEYEVAVNLIVAKELSIELSPDLVRKADRVFKPE